VNNVNVNLHNYCNILQIYTFLA